MNTFTSLPPAADQVMALVRGELSSLRRWFYRGVLLMASLMGALILSLWTTEPRELPLRLHVAFGAMTVIAISWVGVMTWILWRHRCPTAIDRIATGWIATGACGLFLCMTVGIAIARERTDVLAWVALVGVFSLTVAVGMLRNAYALRRRLLAKLAELEGGSK
jgi:hypothetical protein